MNGLPVTNCLGVFATTSLYYLICSMLLGQFNFHPWPIPLYPRMESVSIPMAFPESATYQIPTKDKR